MTGYSRRLAEIGQMNRIGLMATYFRNLSASRHGRRGRLAGYGDELIIGNGMSEDALKSAILRQEATADEDGAP